MTTAADDLDVVIAEYHVAMDRFVKGDHEPAAKLYSRAADASLGNPFGPFARGWESVLAIMRRAASFYRDGEAVGFDRVAEHVAGDLACIVEVERLRSKVGERDEVASLALRVTTIFRREDGAWRIVHRHADPITTAQPAESVVST